MCHYHHAAQNVILTAGLATMMPAGTYNTNMGSFYCYLLRRMASSSPHRKHQNLGLPENPHPAHTQLRLNHQLPLLKKYHDTQALRRPFSLLHSSLLQSPWVFLLLLCLLCRILALSWTAFSPLRSLRRFWVSQRETFKR